MDILSYDAFIKMGYNDTQLTPYDMPIYGFNGVESKIEGTIRLPVTIGQEPREAMQMLNFVVLKLPLLTMRSLGGQTTCL